MVFTARLLEAFAPLQLLLAVLVLAKGAQMVYEAAHKACQDAPAEGGVLRTATVVNAGAHQALLRATHWFPPCPHFRLTTLSCAAVPFA